MTDAKIIKNIREVKMEFHKFDADVILSSPNAEQLTTESVSVPVPEPGIETEHLLPSSATSNLPKNPNNNKLQHHFWCKNCLRSFKSKLKLEKHHKGLLYPCFGLVSSPNINRTPYRQYKNVFKYHLLLAPPTYTCMECETKFDDKTLLEAHLSKNCHFHIGKKNGYSATAASSPSQVLDANINIAERDPLSLTDTDTDAEDSDLKSAARQHNSELNPNSASSLFTVTFNCRAVHCSQKFLSPQLLESHEKLHRKKNAVSVLWKCSRCPRLRPFTVQSDFRRHLLLHSDENAATPFKCSECSIYFPKRISLTRHLENHVGADPGDEEPLSKKAKNLMYLEDSNVDDFSILNPNPNPNGFSKFSISDKEAVAKVTDGKEMQIKSEPVPNADTEIRIGETSKKKEDNRSKVKTCLFKCNVCLKTFSKQSSFKWHMTNQDLSVTYKCLACPDLTFCFKSNLNKHMKTVHVESNASKCSPNNPRNYKYDCKDCQKFFRYEIGLEVHMQEYHQCEKSNYPRIKQETKPDHEGLPLQSVQLPEPEPVPAPVTEPELLASEPIKVEIKVEAVDDIQIKLDPDLFL